MQTGITSLFYSFLDTLKKEKEKLALLQLTGKIEEYLVKEFVYHIHLKSEGNRFALINLGNRGEQKIDICILKGRSPERDDKAKIVGFIEAKYLRNRHRVWKSSAKDEITTTLKSLKKQLHTFKPMKHAEYPVNLSSKRKSIYGLVFASYVNESKDEDDKNRFYKGILEKDIAKKFRYHDLPEPYFRKVYDDVKITVLNTDYHVTMRAGLWRIKE